MSAMSPGMSNTTAQRLHPAWFFCNCDKLTHYLLICLKFLSKVSRPSRNLRLVFHLILKFFKIVEWNFSALNKIERAGWMFDQCEKLSGG